MLPTKFSRELERPVDDILSALPTQVIAWRAHKRLMLIAGATAYLSAATLLLPIIS